MNKFWGRIIYAIGYVCVGLAALIYLRLGSRGRSRVPKHGPVILASNHVSHLDPPLITISTPRYVHNMAKRELFSNQFLRWFMVQVETILVHRGQAKKAIVDAVEMLDEGKCILIFPEGTRSLDGKLSQGRSGAVVLAIRSGAPIVPTAIIGSQRAMPKGSKLVRPHRVLVRYGEPYRIEYEGDKEKIERTVLKREVAVLMHKIEELLPPEMKPEDADKQKWYGSYAGQG